MRKKYPIVSKAVPLAAGGALYFHYAKALESFKSEKEHLLGQVPVSVFFLKLVPLKVFSWIWGQVMSIPIPKTVRPLVYQTYACATGANLDEVRDQLVSYPSLNAFFTRRLKEGIRPIDRASDLISPSDGKVLGYGVILNELQDTHSVDNIIIDHVKGFRFPIKQFLGEYKDTSSNQQDSTDILIDQPKGSPTSLSTLQEVDLASNEFISFVDPIPRSLYYCSLYLSPADYHRVHSPTEWSLSSMRHVYGELLPVFPALLRRIPSIYVLNERIPLIGTWKHGRFSMTLVGSTNVGNIKVYGDKNLLRPADLVKPWTASMSLNAKTPMPLERGDEVGYFQMGSTVVLIFEAPQNFSFTVEEGQHVAMGSPLGKITN